MPPGGRRPNAGRKKGFRFPSTLSKEAARLHVQQRVAAELDALLDAQLAHAKGLSYLVARDKETGKFRRLSAGGVDALTEGEVIEVWEKDPNVQAFTDLLNRALDKPKEQPAELNLNVSSDLADKIAEGRARAAERNKKR